MQQRLPLIAASAMEAYVTWGEGVDALVSAALGLNYSATSATWIYVPVSSWDCHP